MSQQKEILNTFEQKRCGQIMVANHKKIGIADIGNVTARTKKWIKVNF